MPSESDEWMSFEMGVLKEFTRIFPMLPDKVTVVDTLIDRRIDTLMIVYTLTN